MAPKEITEKLYTQSIGHYCTACSHYVPMLNGKGEERMGECRRRSPRLMAGTNRGRWPTVKMYQTCGEYERKEESK